jgi:hypothetical protein
MAAAWCGRNCNKAQHGVHRGKEGTENVFMLFSVPSVPPCAPCYAFPSHLKAPGHPGGRSYCSVGSANAFLSFASPSFPVTRCAIYSPITGPNLNPSA